MLFIKVQEIILNVTRIESIKPIEQKFGSQLYEIRIFMIDSDGYYNFHYENENKRDMALLDIYGKLPRSR